jgi:C4-dicarboxylate-specific signal transduction histidine kinase
VVAANRQSVCGHVARWLIHDLRGPAQALTLLTGIMDDEPGQTELPIAETLREATSHAARSLELLDRLLIHAPVGAEAGPVSLLDSLRFISSVYQINHTPVALEIGSAGVDRLPAVRGVSHELELVLLNLVLNSLQALRGRAAGRILITASDLGTKVQVIVKDDGPGIAPALRSRLFEPFVSGWNVPGYVGLGLAASRTLLERHGGSLAYAPSDEPGATFVLELPAVGPADDSGGE